MKVSYELTKGEVLQVVVGKGGARSPTSLDPKSSGGAPNGGHG